MSSIFEKATKKSLLSWCLFDWANSSFPTLILTFVFATYFTKSVAKNTILGTSQWGDAVAIGGLLIAVLSPIFGAIADHEGRRKPWLFLFTLLCIIASFMLWYTDPNPSNVTWALVWLVLGIIGFEVGMVFYNSMLDDLAPTKYLGRISGWGWGLGYFGGLASLIIMLYVIHVHDSLEIRAVGPFVAIWFATFSWPLFLFTQDRPSTGMTYRDAIKKGLRSLYQTLSSLRQNKEVFKFLLARVFYIDGLNTIFSFGGIYAAGTFHMTFSEVIQFGIAMNVAAGLGAMAFAWMDDFKGSKPTILLSIFIMLFCASAMLIIHSKLLFWIYGMGLSLCVGPIQAASRSLLIRLSTKKQLTEMFGLYAFSGKATTFLGPLILAWLTLTFSSQRIGMSIVVLFLLLGAVLLSFVKSTKPG